MQSGSIASGPVLSSEIVVTRGTGQEGLLYDAVLVSAHPDCTTMACPSFGTVWAGKEI